MITTPEVCPIAQRLLLWAPLCTAQAISQLPIRKTQTLVFQHDPSLVEKPGFLLLSSPSVAFSVVLHELKGIATKAVGRSRSVDLSYTKTHISSVSLQLLRKLAGKRPS